MAQVAKIHAEHIFDWDALHGGQYFYLSALGVFPPSIVSGPLNTGVPTIIINTYFPNSSLVQADDALKYFIDDVQKKVVEGGGGIVNLTQRSVLQNINDALPPMILLVLIWCLGLDLYLLRRIEGMLLL